MKNMYNKGMKKAKVELGDMEREAKRDVRDLEHGMKDLKMDVEDKVKREYRGSPRYDNH